MGKVSTFVGLDVHKKRIAVAVARAGIETPEWWGMVEHTPEGLGKLARRLGEPGDMLACYEAGPCGHTLRRRLESLGIATIVVAPSLIPRKPGDRVKTDRKDALKLAKELRSGDLTAVWTPDLAQEGLRDLTRAREAAKGDLHQVRQRITKMLLRLGIEEPGELKTRWSQKYERWVAGVRFDLYEQQVVWEGLLEAMQQAKARLKKLESISRRRLRGAPLRD